MKTRIIAALTFGLMLLASNSFAQQWEIVGRQGSTVMVYIEPQGLKDKYLVAQALGAMVRREDPSRPIQIFLFDAKRHTPVGLPMTDQQMLHWRARYGKNPARRYEKFEWVSVKDRSSSPPKLAFKEARIRPGFAE